jgi:ABC-type proline/glycine betaine transport system permease subunit
MPVNLAQQADIALRAESAAQFGRWHLVLSGIVGVLLTLAAVAIYQNSQRIIATANVWGTCSSLLIMGLMLYWIRSRWRLTYGFFEYLIGALGSMAVFWPDFDYAQLTTLRSIQVVGGLYVMVRGLDNIGKGLESTRWAGLWRRAFGERAG